MLQTIARRSFRPFYMSNLFDEDLFPVNRNRTNPMPAVNIREDEKKYTLELAVPGMDRKDLKIDVNEDVLTISSELKNEKVEEKNGYSRKEFSFTSFCRNFYIPENVNRDNIEASYRDGILTVGLPKQTEEKSKVTRQINIG